MTILEWLQTHLNTWTIIGLCGQLLFMARFIVQWIASERVKKSIVPEVFWYFSLSGGAVLFIYALHLDDIVFTLGQGLGLIIYLRNIWFIRKNKGSVNA